MIGIYTIPESRRFSVLEIRQEISLFEDIL